MKVTVCFGSVRVVVPCGDGNLLVSELIDKAIVRYKKATGKSADYWVAVHNLKAADGGILDNDDRLVDVADDREQILALYEEQGGPPLHHNGGDGTSASSVGTSSPDIFHTQPDSTDKRGFRPFVRDGGKNDVVITQNDLPTGSSLIVRRGSEPVLTNIGNSPSDKRLEVFPVSPNKRWSAIANLDEAKVPRDTHEDHTHNQRASSCHRPPPHPQRSDGSGEERGGGAREGEPDDVISEGSVHGFTRDTTRRSLANNAAMWQWLEAQENQQIRLQGTDRKEPLGGSGDPEDKENFYPDEDSVTVILKNTRGPLGIHVVPDYRNDGSDTGGLVIQGIDPRGRIYQDGRLKVLDKIIEINGTSLKNVQFSKAQELFKQALETPELQLKVLQKDQPPPLPQQPPPLSLPIRTLSGSSTDNQDGGPSEGEPAVSPPSSPSKKTPPPLPVRAPTTALTSMGSQGKGKIIAPTNTKRIGRKMLIVLKKGSQGLGFSVTTRDNPAGGVPPIYIKNILPKGAAIEDGRLLSGDRLLEVNGEDVSGKSQSEVVAMLRTTPLGSTVNLVVSRIVQEDEKFTVPREMSDSQTSSPFKGTLSQNSQSSATSSPSHDALQPPEKSPDQDEDLLRTQEKQVLSLDIPLSDSGSAGLGVSVKGRTSTMGQKVHDMGIFIKSVISGGAASKDGRLMVNDQLIKVNGENLSGKSNTFAMETLRKAMQKEGPVTGKIHLVISRRKGAESSTTDSPSSREIRISQSEQSDGQPSSQNTGAMVMDANANKRNYQDLNIANKDGAVNKLASSSLVIGRTMAEGVPSSNESGAMGRLIGESSLIGRSVAIGGGDSNKLRNTSYQIATEETLDQTALEGEPADLTRQTDHVDSRDGRSPGVTVKPRPASTIGFQHHETPEQAAARVTKSNENLMDDTARQKWDQNPDMLQDEGLTPTEDLGFSREGFGRQSMSEKRKGHLDPRMSEFYQKVKDLRDKRSDQYASGQIARIGSAESLLGSHLYNPEAPAHMHESKSPGYYQLGPTLGLKKSSSLESLQTAVQEVTLEEEAKKDGVHYRPSGNRGMVRGRGCNESFRAAVDRSYEQQEPMETLPVSVEEEGESETGSSLGGHHETSLGRNNSQASSMVTGEQDLSVSSGGDDKKKHRKNSKKDKSKKEKKEEGGNKGIFSGLFKFGKSRKASDPSDEKSTYQKSSPSERTAQTENSAKPEQERIQEQQRMLQEKQRQLEVAKQREEEHRLHQQRQQQQPQNSYREPTPGGLSPSSRAEKIQALRSIHQQKHRERQGVYPQDDKEDNIERYLQSFEKKKTDVTVSPDRYGSQSMLPPPRRQPTPERPERTRSVQDSDQYSHYANIEEIRQQLRHHDYLQQQHRFQAAMSRQQTRPQPRGLPPAIPGGPPSHPQRSQLPPSGPPGRSQSNVHQQSSNSSHYADPRQLRNHPQAQQLYSRSYGPDSKGPWASYHGNGRSLTPAPTGTGTTNNRTASPSPTRPRAQTPGYSPGYHSPHSRTPYQTAVAPPGRAFVATNNSNNPQATESAFHHQNLHQLSNNVQTRHYSSEYEAQGAHAYTRERVEASSYQHEPHFGLLPRRREPYHSGSSNVRGAQGLGLMSSSAQV